MALKYFSLGERLPRFLAAPLFGDRARHGLTPDRTDPCWVEWQERYPDFYYANQKQSIGAIVNNSGYKIMSTVDFTGMRVLEVGPGDIRHLGCMRSKPDEYVIVDNRADWLDKSGEVLRQAGMKFSKHLIAEDQGLAVFPDNSFDCIVSFYSLEHISPLDGYLKEFQRILKPGGKLVGAIPGEGGMAWGLGRYLTSRRWLRTNTSIDPDKIICWEHPNFASGVLRSLDAGFTKKRLRFWPLRLPVIDMNLVISFLYVNDQECSQGSG